MVTIFGARFMPELDMKQEYRGTLRVEKVTEVVLVGNCVSRSNSLREMEAQNPCASLKTDDCSLTSVLFPF
jgi:hypothetical protein